jgi:hypothetical protein
MQRCTCMLHATLHAACHASSVACCCGDPPRPQRQRPRPADAECRRLHSFLRNSCVLQPGELWPQPSCESLADFDDEAPPHPPHHPLEQIPPSPPQGHRTAQVRAHAALTRRSRAEHRTIRCERAAPRAVLCRVRQAACDVRRATCNVQRATKPRDGPRGGVGLAACDVPETTAVSSATAAARCCSPAGRTRPARLRARTS